MASKGLNAMQRNQDELQQIMTHIRNGDNFLLSGGAGSGKTYTLVQVIERTLQDYPVYKIACITYTNAAVKEIQDRFRHNNLFVSTIHKFLWDNIKHFQAELKSSLIALINDEECKRIKVNQPLSVSDDFYSTLEDGIQYKEFLNIQEGIISHDELLVLANHMFKTHRKLCGILKDQFKFIFVDEYQDTQPEVVEILLTHLSQSEKKATIGFFGDAMQSIYDDGIGDLNDYKSNPTNPVREVKKEQNRRNPRLVYELANKLRTDGLVQRNSNDLKAPNMLENGSVKEGCVQFLYSETGELNSAKDFLGWDFLNPETTKELNLTHNLIAGKAGFQSLMDIYSNDKILDYVRRIKKHIKDKKVMNDFTNMSFGEVIEFLKNGKTGKELKTVQPTKGMQEFIDSNHDLYENAKNEPYLLLSKIYVDKDQLIDDRKADANDESGTGSKRDDLVKHLVKIQNNIELYENKNFNEFIRKTEYQIKSVKDKKELKSAIDFLVETNGKTIGEIIKYANDSGICKIDDRLKRFQEQKNYVYNRVENVKYHEFRNLYEYIEGHTPFSTQHKTKGTEYDNVLIVLDNGGWNNYNFENLFTSSGKPSVLERTQKIFYVCCTRSKENLAVFYHNPSNDVINKAIEWFGEENVFNLDEE